MSRPLRFLHLTTFYPPYSFGGDAMYIYRLAHLLAGQGHEVDVIHCRDAYHLLHPGEPEISYQEHPGVKAHAISTGHKWLSPFLTHQTGHPGLKLKAITEVMRRKHYDVIHYHNISLLGPAVLALEPDHAHFVKLYTTHEHWLICPTHVLWKYNRRACEKPNCLSCVIRSGRPPQIWRYTGLLKRMSRHVDLFVSPSRFTAKMHSSRGFAQPVEHLPYFVQRSDDDWQQPGPRPQQRPYFIFVGRLERIKGLHTLLDVWKQAGDNDLLVAGIGDYEEELKERAKADPRIRFLGKLTQAELGRLYSHAVATIVPSVTYETFGIIIIESFARKTPVVVRDLGALPEVVAESGGGFVYRTDDELLDQVSRLSKSPELARDLGEKGYRCFVRNWSPEAHMRQYFSALEKVAYEKLGSVPWATR